MLAMLKELGKWKYELRLYQLSKLDNPVTLQIYSDILDK